MVTVNFKHNKTTKQLNSSYQAVGCLKSTLFENKKVSKYIISRAEIPTSN